MSLRNRICFGAVVGVLLVPGPARGQEEPEFDPPNQELDRELDESLHRAYEEGFQDGRRDAAPAPAPRRASEPAPDYAAEVGEDDDIRLGLGGIAAHYYTVLQDVTLAHRNGASGGAEIELDDDAFDAADYRDDPEHSQTYRAWLDLGRHVSLEGGFRRTVYRSERPTRQSFTYGDTTYAAGDVVDSELDIAIADLDLVIKPVNMDVFELGIHLGARYVRWDTKLARAGNATSPGIEEERLEAAVPVIGLSMAVRPVSALEIFARGRIGHLEYERDEYWRVDDDGDVDHVDAKARESTSVELEAGLMLVLADTIGVVVGYRFDYIDLEREVTGRSEKVEGKSHGGYAGLVLQF